MARTPKVRKITVSLNDEEARVLGQMCKRFGYDEAKRLSDAYDGGKERDAMIDAVISLRSALADAGFAPR
ncbi:hypothetical protein [Methylosinus sp. Ce-a6]|uniref:DUF7706 family protein n=1 Tax=Methylosinus sp. Ce-a6 TaxID=2172005 RepID=UPI00135A5C2C|nr:hypothetical protein [Methylosinus sp. Ce-a6]